MEWKSHRRCTPATIAPFNFRSRLFFAVAFVTFVILLPMLPFRSIAQIPINYDRFKHLPGQPVIILPQPSVIMPVTITPLNDMPVNRHNLTALPNVNIIDQYTQEMNRALLREQEAISNQYAHAGLPEDIRMDLMEQERESAYNKWVEKSAYYRSAYGQLLHLNPDSFSLTKAVYIVENAFLESRYSFAEFQSWLKREAKIIQSHLKAEKLNATESMALNYGIQKRFRIGGQYYDPRKKAMVKAKPFQYDFQDYMGTKDYRQMFVSKMLATGKGQCHSMPLAYLMLAEQLGAKAWLSLSPEHSFIRFMDAKGNLLNFETTSGNLVSTNWLHQSGYITAAALKNRIYLDTLSQRELYAQCLADLLQGYLKKFKYDGFAETLRQHVLQLNPRNMTALIIGANIKRTTAWNQIVAAGKPAEKDLPQYPEAYRAYLDMQAAFDKVDGMGYQEMPTEAYQQWLKSIDQEKKKQENQELQQRLQREIEYMKRNKPKVIIRNKID